MTGSPENNGLRRAGIGESKAVHRFLYRGARWSVLVASLLAGLI